MEEIRIKVEFAPLQLFVRPLYPHTLLTNCLLLFQPQSLEWMFVMDDLFTLPLELFSRKVHDC